MSSVDNSNSSRDSNVNRNSQSSLPAQSEKMKKNPLKKLSSKLRNWVSSSTNSTSGPKKLTKKITLSRGSKTSRTTDNIAQNTFSLKNSLETKDKKTLNSALNKNWHSEPPFEKLLTLNSLLTADLKNNAPMILEINKAKGEVLNEIRSTFTESSNPRTVADKLVKNDKWTEKTSLKKEEDINSLISDLQKAFSKTAHYKKITVPIINELNKIKEVEVSKANVLKSSLPQESNSPNSMANNKLSPKDLKEKLDAYEKTVDRLFEETNPKNKELSQTIFELFELIEQNPKGSGKASAFIILLRSKLTNTHE